MNQLFTRTTAVLNLLVWLAVLIGTVVGPQWLAVTAWIGAFAVTGWTVYAAWRAGADPFPDLRDRPQVREHDGSAEPKSWLPSGLRFRLTRGAAARPSPPGGDAPADPLPHP